MTDEDFGKIVKGILTPETILQIVHNLADIANGNKKLTFHTEVGYTDSEHPTKPTGYTTTVEVE